MEQEITKLLNSNIFFDKITEIGEKHDLHIDQIGGLDSETRELALGMKKKDDFVKNISTHLEIPEELSIKIAKDVNEGIFLKIRELMREGYSSVENNESLKTDSPVSIPIKTIGETTVIKETPTIETPAELNNKNPEGLKPFAEPKTMPQPVIEPTVTHLGEKIETPDEILKHIEELPELPRPTAGQVVENTTTQNVSPEKQNIVETPTIKENSPIENKLQKAPDTRKYIVDPYREPAE